MKPTCEWSPGDSFEPSLLHTLNFKKNITRKAIILNSMDLAFKGSWTAPFVPCAHSSRSPLLSLMVIPLEHWLSWKWPSLLTISSRLFLCFTSLKPSKVHRLLVKNLLPHPFPQLWPLSLLLTARLDWLMWCLYCTTWVYGYLANWAPLWPKLNLA